MTHDLARKSTWLGVLNFSTGLELSTGTWEFCSTAGVVEASVHPGCVTLGRMGDEFFKRALPVWVPKTTTELQRAGLSMWAIRRDNVRVAKGVWIPREKEPEWRGCIVSRGRAQWLAAPDYALTGFAALAFFGLKYWADQADVVVASREAVPHRQPEGSQMARIEQSRHAYLCMPDRYVGDLKCVDEIEAIVSALKVVLRSELVWHVPAVPGWTDVEIRGVQLLDAVRRLFGTRLYSPRLQERAHQRISNRWLKKIQKASSAKADSPQETLMRLLVQGITAKSRSARSTVVEWEEQVVIYPDGTMRGAGESRQRYDSEGNFIPWLTVADLVSRDLKIVLFYDGEHHRDASQHHRDAEIDATLQDQGFLVLRVTGRMLAEGDVLTARVERMVDRVLADR